MGPQADPFADPFGGAMLEEPEDTVTLPASVVQNLFGGLLKSMPMREGLWPNCLWGLCSSSDPWIFDSFSFSQEVSTEEVVLGAMHQEGLTLSPQALGGTGLVYDPRMMAHEERSKKHPEQPARISSIFVELEAQGMTRTPSPDNPTHDT